MKKTFNANISGMVFTIDVDAYDLLSGYLDTLHDAFRNHDEGAEIIQDIEMRIAEHFTSKTSCGINVITIKDVDNVISLIGRPEQIVDVESEDSINESDIEIDQTAVEPPELPEIKKRFFRDTQDKMLGGVCSGIAHYIDVDPTWIRLTFVIMMFCSFSTLLLVYLILWIIVPAANTPLKRMQMYGESVTIQNIGRTVTETFQQTGSYLRGEKASLPTDSVSGILALIFSWSARILLFLIIAISIPTLLLLALVFCCGIVSIILYNTHLWPYIEGWHTLLAPGIFLNNHNIVLIIVMVTAMCIVIGIPLFVLLRIIFTKNGNNPIPIKWRATLMSIWSIGVVTEIISLIMFYMM